MVDLCFLYDILQWLVKIDRQGSACQLFHKIIFWVHFVRNCSALNRYFADDGVVFQEIQRLLVSMLNLDLSLHGSMAEHELVNSNDTSTQQLVGKAPRFGLGVGSP